MTAAAFSATYSDWKLIRSRKVVQIVLEIPIEKSDEAYQVMGGMPDPGAEKWFAVAALREEPKVSGGEGAVPSRRAAELLPTPSVSRPSEPPPPTRKPVDPAKRTLAQQCAIACHDPAFWQWISDFERMPIERYNSAEKAADWVRTKLRIKSRSEIVEGSGAAVVWKQCHDDYIIKRDYADNLSIDGRIIPDRCGVEGEKV